MDAAILFFIQEHLASPLGDAIMPVITHLGSGGLIWFIVAAILLARRETRPAGVVMIIAVVLSAAFVSLSLKPLFDRPRPFQAYPSDILIAPPAGSSFPSGHSAASFAGATAYLLMRKNKRGWLLLALAALIAFSRLYLFVHYPSDVLVGALTGVIFAFLAKWLYLYALQRLGSDHD